MSYPNGSPYGYPGFYGVPPPELYPMAYPVPQQAYLPQPMYAPQQQWQPPQVPMETQTELETKLLIQKEKEQRRMKDLFNKARAAEAANADRHQNPRQDAFQEPINAASDSEIQGNHQYPSPALAQIPSSPWSKPAGDVQVFFPPRGTFAQAQSVSRQERQSNLSSLYGGGRNPWAPGPSPSIILPRQSPAAPRSPLAARATPAQIPAPAHDHVHAEFDDSSGTDPDGNEDDDADEVLLQTLNAHSSPTSLTEQHVELRQTITPQAHPQAPGQPAAQARQSPQATSPPIAISNVKPQPAMTRSNPPLSGPALRRSQRIKHGLELCDSLLEGGSVSYVQLLTSMRVPRHTWLINSDAKAIETRMSDPKLGRPLVQFRNARYAVLPSRMQVKSILATAQTPPSPRNENGTSAAMSDGGSSPRIVLAPPVPAPDTVAAPTWVPNKQPATELFKR
eukprot:TRINITY_DN5336_c0_g1_i1.p1 TRINITY_DN5336_c0_g1~~TRINITY_DN5336_c0_g1_i1.p1  ORF type:complete len:451 (+),score=52.16 TRINITY_DN5336_c0_g1_i1:129-1481(+)